MSADASAYAVLGLKPGADRAAIDSAYKRLIKRYHPDRHGGDSDRAAEINRAYFELRERREQAPHRDTPADISEAIYARRAARRRLKPLPRRLSPVPPTLMLGAVLLGILFKAPLSALVDRVDQAFTDAIEPDVGYASSSANVERSDLLDEPLERAVIGRSIADARRLVMAGDADAIADHSRQCHRDLRTDPTAALLDRCAAFDYAVVVLSRRDLLRDEGPFSATAVTARQMTAAKLLTDDYAAIENRLDEIRSRVELTIAPAPSVQAGLTAREERRGD